MVFKEKGNLKLHLGSTSEAKCLFKFLAKVPSIFRDSLYWRHTRMHFKYVLGYRTCYVLKNYP
jgi:hypothetical protein